MSITRPTAIICDLDGTLCDIKHRLHFIQREKKDWESFQRNCFGDKLNAWCKELIISMHEKGHQVLLFSGRMDYVRTETEDWLSRYDIPYHSLRMRKDKDYRPDHEIKVEMLNEVRGRFDILFCVDDRKQVVDMWRREGLVCLQCQEGDY